MPAAPTPADRDDELNHHRFHSRPRPYQSNTTYAHRAADQYSEAFEQAPSRAYSDQWAHLEPHSTHQPLDSHAATYADTNSQRLGYDSMNGGHIDNVYDAACPVRSCRSTYPNFPMPGHMPYLRHNTDRGTPYESCSERQLPSQQLSHHPTGPYNRADDEAQRPNLSSLNEGSLRLDQSRNAFLDSNHYQHHLAERPFGHPIDELEDDAQLELDYRHQYKCRDLSTRQLDHKTLCCEPTHGPEMTRGLGFTDHLSPEFNEHPELDQEFRRLGLNGHGSSGNVRKLEDSATRVAAAQEHCKRSHLPWEMPESYRSTEGFLQGEWFSPTYGSIPVAPLPATQPLSSYPVSHPRLLAAPIPPYSDFPSQTYHPTPLPLPYHSPGELLPHHPALPSHFPDRLKIDHSFGDAMHEASSPYRNTSFLTNGFDIFKCIGVYYSGISSVYNQVGELELQRIVEWPLDSVLVSDPFPNPIPIDYGYGMMKSLSDYGVQIGQLDCLDAVCLDDIYLFEQVLRNDPLLTDSERLRLWNRRMHWEEISTQTRLQQWEMMSAAQRGLLGIDVGGWWAYRLRMAPLDTTYGHQREVVGAGGLFERHSSGFRRGKFDAHYPLSPSLKSRYPFWRDGGFGVGRSLIKWLELPTSDAQSDIRSGSESVSPPISSHAVDDKALRASVEARDQLDLKRQKEELIDRKLAAEYRRAHLVASIQAQTSLPLSASQLASAGLYAHSSSMPTRYPENGMMHSLYRPVHLFHGPSWSRPDPYGPASHHVAAALAGMNLPKVPEINFGQPSGTVHPSGPSYHRPVAGLPWGSLLSELRKRDNPASNLKSRSALSHPRDDNMPGSSVSEANKACGGAGRNADTKKLRSMRMELESSVTSQAPPPPAYHPSGSGSSAKVGLPQPPALFKVQDFGKTGSSHSVPERTSIAGNV